MTYDHSLQQRFRFIGEHLSTERMHFLANFGGAALIVRPEEVPLPGHPLDFEIVAELDPKFAGAISILDEAIERVTFAGLRAIGPMRFQLANAVALPQHVLGAVADCFSGCRAQEPQVKEFFGAVSHGVGVIAKSQRVLRPSEIERVRWETIIDVQQRLAFGGCRALAA